MPWPAAWTAGDRGGVAAVTRPVAAGPIGVEIGPEFGRGRARPRARDEGSPGDLDSNRAPPIFALPGHADAADAAGSLGSTG